MPGIPGVHSPGQPPTAPLQAVARDPPAMAGGGRVARSVQSRRKGGTSMSESPTLRLLRSVSSEVTQTVILTRVAGRTPMPPGEELEAFEAGRDHGHPDFVDQ